MDKNGSDNEDKRDFDWESVHQSIAEANAALAGVDEIAPEALVQAWARRAEQLALVPIETDEADRLELVLVQLGREIYGLDVQYVFDIKPAERITRVPRVPEWVAGITSLRGRIFSAVDLRRFFDLPQAETNEQTIIEPELVVVETPDMELALLVDEVLGVEALSASQMQQAPAASRSIPTEYIQGIIARQSEEVSENGKRSLITVLNLPALLADDRLVVQEEVV